MSAPLASGVQPVPARAGIGLRPPHFTHVLQTRPPVSFFEVHSENFFADGGPLLDTLLRVREHYPVSLHGVGLSLGSADRIDREHLRQLATLVTRVQLGLVSEHVCWGAIGGRHFNDLLPLPYTEEALALMVSRVDQVQQALGRELLLENVSSYLRYTHETMNEWEFLAALCQRSGCRLVLDVNNIYVNAVNHGFDADTFVQAITPQMVGEFHLAGFTAKTDLAVPLLIDSHSAPVAAPVWDLYTRAVARLGVHPTLLEWDTDLPAFCGA